MNNTVTFNVGGTRYEISQSLLNQFPDSMLAKSISDTWNKNPNKDIFIERDGRRFGIVLDYMRDGRAILPDGIPKISLMADLEYFGIEYDETCIDDKESLMKSLPSVLTDVHDYIKYLNFRSTCDKVAVLCIKKYLGKGGYHISISSRVEEDNYNILKAFSTIIRRDQTKCTKIINQSLGKVGLKFVKLAVKRDAFSNGVYSVEVKRIKTKLT